jgi:hypothetical protein
MGLSNGKMASLNEGERRSKMSKRPMEPCRMYETCSAHATVPRRQWALGTDWHGTEGVMCAGRVWAGTLIEWRGGQWECEPSQQTSCLWSSGEREPRMDCSSNTARTCASRAKMLCYVMLCYGAYLRSGVDRGVSRRTMAREERDPGHRDGKGAAACQGGWHAKSGLQDSGMAHVEQETAAWHA